MTRRLPALLAAAAVAAGLLAAAPTANADTLPASNVSTSGRAMCLVVDGQPQAVCLDYPGVLDLVGGILG